ncbi:MAG: hypothetical protein ACTSSM_12245 [Promethearchaeota archaeon]
MQSKPIATAASTHLENTDVSVASTILFNSSIHPSGFSFFRFSIVSKNSFSTIHYIPPIHAIYKDKKDCSVININFMMLYKKICGISINSIIEMACF